MHTARASLGPMRRECRTSASREPRERVPSPGSEVFPRVDWTRCRTCSCWRTSRRCCAARRPRSRDDCAHTSFLYRRCPRSTSGRGGARRPCCGGRPTEDPDGHAREEGRRERGAHAEAEADCGHGTKGSQHHRTRAPQLRRDGSCRFSTSSDPIALRKPERLKSKIARKKALFLGETGLNRLARPAGFEPATLGLEGRCSIQLSYRRVGSVELPLISR